MEIKRNGANGRRAQSVSYNGILYTSGITTTDLDADITGQTQDVIHIIDNILALNHIQFREWTVQNQRIFFSFETSLTLKHL